VYQTLRVVYCSPPSNEMTPPTPLKRSVLTDVRLVLRRWSVDHVLRSSSFVASFASFVSFAAVTAFVASSAPVAPEGGNGRVGPAFRGSTDDVQQAVARVDHSG